MPIKKVFYLTKSQYETLIQYGTVTIGGIAYTWNSDDMYCIEDTLYRHNVSITGTDGNGNDYRVFLTIYNKDGTAFDDTSIFDYVQDNHPVACSGYSQNSSVKNIDYLDGDVSSVYIVGGQLETQIDITGTMTVSDIYVEVE